MKITDKEFIETVFEIAFGANAVSRDFDRNKVIERIQYYSDKALEMEELENEQAYENSLNDFYGSSTPMTVNEQQRSAQKLK